MEKIRLNLYLSPDHPIAQIEKGRRAAAVYEILDNWYNKEQQFKNIEKKVDQILEILSNGAIISTPPPKKDEAHEQMMNEVMMDILNMGKK